MGQPLGIYDEWPQQESRRRWIVLDVSLVGGNGERWHSVGLGETVADALTWARESAPAGTRWLVSGWSDLFGD